METTILRVESFVESAVHEKRFAFVIDQITPVAPHDTRDLLEGLTQLHAPRPSYFLSVAENEPADHETCSDNERPPFPSTSF
jgi:hypothetical protein